MLLGRRNPFQPTVASSFFPSKGHHHSAFITSESLGIPWNPLESPGIPSEKGPESPAKARGKPAQWLRLVLLLKAVREERLGWSREDKRKAADTTAAVVGAPNVWTGRGWNEIGGVGSAHQK